MRTKNYSKTKNVLEAAIERMEYLYDTYDEVIVSFSGGKDSTAVLNVALHVARKRGRLPVKAQFFDEEAIHPPTIEYVERVRSNPEILLEWFCLPFQHRNACSTTQPYWNCWDPAEEDKWTRPMPPFGITKHRFFKKNISVPLFSDAIAKEISKTKRVVILTGIRTQESLRRYRMIALRGENSYITHGNGFSKAHPIYDWSSEDVWRLVKEWDLDYNRTYDIFNITQKLGGKLLQQRVCPPYGEEPLRGIAIYAECFPDMWQKMVNRVPGANAARMYSNTDLYLANKKPEGMTWKEYSGVILDLYEGETKALVLSSVNEVITIHENKTKDRIPDDKPHPNTGCTWKFICKVALKGDLKSRTGQSMLTNIT